jgi:uncharacterized protein DUF4267
MLRAKRIDPVGRQLVLGIAAGRVGVGLGALLATGPALRALGFPQADATGRALARLAGSRDIAVGLLTIATRGERRTLRTATALSAAVDAADAVAFAALLGDPASRRAGTLGVASGAAAALVGLWAAQRL